MKSSINNIYGSVKHALSREYLVLFLALLAVFLMAYFNEKFTYYFPENGIDKMNIEIEKSTYSSVPYNLLWFAFDNEIIRLNVNMLCDDGGINIYALTCEGKIKSIQHSNDSIALDKAFSGSFAVALPPFDADIDNDGSKETLKLYAKTDTIHTQGFIPVRTNFSSQEVQMEIIKSGDRKIQVLYDMKPLENKEVQLISRRGFNKTLKTDAFGMLTVEDMRDLREGIGVVYRQNNIYSIASYTVESTTLFTKNHFKAMVPFIKALMISVFIILLVYFSRKLHYRYGKKSQLSSDL